MSKILPDGQPKAMREEVTAVLDKIKKENPEMESEVEHGKRIVSDSTCQIEYWVKFAASNEADFLRFEIALLWMHTHAEKINTIVSRVEMQRLTLNLTKIVSPKMDAEVHKKIRAEVFKILGEINEIGQEVKKSMPSPKPADPRLSA